MKRFSVRFLLFLSAALFVLFLGSPDTVQRTAHESVLFCAAVLIPSLFPGFVLSDLIIGLSSGKQRNPGGLFFRIFRIQASCIRCWIIGLLAGFPAAAGCASQMVLFGEISKNDGERCLAFTNNPGIVFVVCGVGSGLFGHFSVGIYLWAVQTVAAIFVGIVMADPNRKNHSSVVSISNPVSLNRAFPKAVVSSVASVLNICGFVVFFRVLIAVLTSAIPLNSFKILLSGLLEITCGISQLKEFSFVSAILASLMLGWSGFSVHFQILNVISVAELSPKYYFPGKVLQAIFSAGITVATYSIFFKSSIVPNAGLTICLSILFIFIIFVIRFRKEHLYGKQKLRTGKTTSRLCS